MESLHGTRRFPLWLIVCGFAVCNFCIPLTIVWLDPVGMLPFAFLIGFFYGFVAGECGLLAIWGVLGPLGAPARLLLTLAIGVILMVSSLVGVVAAEPPGDTLGEMLAAVLFLPLILVAAQTPIWGFRLLSGGAISHLGTDPSRSPTMRRQFELRHVMGGTVVVAVALSMASSGMRVYKADETGDWIPLLVGCLLAAVASALATLPCIWAVLIARNKRVATGVVVVYGLLMSLLVVVVVGLLFQVPMSRDEVVLSFVFHATLMAVILGTLHVARLCGYVFAGRRRPQPGPESDCPFAVQVDLPGNTQSSEAACAGDGEPGEPVGGAER